MTQYVQAKVASMERPITAWALAGIAVMLLFMYAYFVNGAIQNIVATRDMQSQIASLSSKVGDLEAAYLAAQSSITSDYAHSLGFKDVSVGTSFVAKRSVGSLSFNR